MRARRLRSRNQVRPDRLRLARPAVMVVVLVAVGCHAGPAERANHEPEPAGRADTALDRYVAAPDPHFAWKVVRTASTPGVTAALIEMTSQQWLTAAEVQQPLWTHWLTVIRPPQVTSDIGLLYIGGGANDGKVPPVPGWLADIARDTMHNAECRMQNAELLT